MRAGWLVLALLGTVSCGGGRDDLIRDLNLSQEIHDRSSRDQSVRETFARRTIVIAESISEPISWSTDAYEAPSARPRGAFRNTYYHFPTDGAEDGERTLYDASCQKIADVSKSFHDSVCIQGSGKLASGQTVSFARRDCECAAVCPRTDQRICFEALDPKRFPWGRGARGKPITPLVSVAVDTSVIPFGTRIFVPQAVGLPRADGTAHDGCFVAEDRGLRIVGEHIDIFTGDPSMTAVWNARLPSHRGVDVLLDAPECAN